MQRIAQFDVYSRRGEISSIHLRFWPLSSIKCLHLQVIMTLISAFDILFIIIVDTNTFHCS